MDFPSIMRFLRGGIAFGAVAIQRSQQQENFVIVVGVMSSSAGFQSLFSENDSRRCYWILPALTDSLWEIDPLRYAYLKFRCHQAAAFQSKDYFENTVKRQQSCKTFQMSSNESLSARFNSRNKTFLYQTLYLNLEYKAKVVDFRKGCDYFELARFYRTLNRDHLKTSTRRLEKQVEQ